MNIIIPSRSILHKLNPIGLGTSAVESLVSYFCRLANSHSCSTMDLAQLVIEHIASERWSAYQSIGGKNRFVWYERSISGIGQSAQLWAETLSTLTSIPSLSWLTMTPLQPIIASKGMMSTQERWCSHCFNEDLLQNKTPYFRLAWDIGINKICDKHQVALTEYCPHCKKNNVRHSANFVVPGWCTSCHHFLGLQAIEKPPLLDDKELERTREIESLLMLFSESRLSTNLSTLHKTIEILIQKLDNDVNAHFAKRIGVQK